MRIGTRKQAGAGRLFRFGYVVLAVAACTAAAASYAIAGRMVTRGGKRAEEGVRPEVASRGAGARFQPASGHRRGPCPLRQVLTCGGTRCGLAGRAESAAPS